MRRSTLVVLTALGISIAGPAWADDAAVKYRQNHMKVLGGHMGSIVALVKGEAPFSEQLAVHARGLANNAVFTKAVFEQQASNGDSTSKPEVWTDWDEFAAKADAMKTAADKLAVAAEAEDRNGIRASVSELGRTCKGCHDDYRLKK